MIILTYFGIEVYIESLNFLSIGYYSIDMSIYWMSSCKIWPTILIKMLLENDFIIPYIQSCLLRLIPFSIHVIDSEQNIFKGRTLWNSITEWYSYPNQHSLNTTIQSVCNTPKWNTSNPTSALISWRHIVNCQYV